MRSTTFLISSKLPIFGMDVVIYKLPHFFCSLHGLTWDAALGAGGWTFGSDIPHFVIPFGYVKYVHNATARQLASLSIWKAKL